MSFELTPLVSSSERSTPSAEFLQVQNEGENLGQPNVRVVNFVTGPNPNRDPHFTNVVLLTHLDGDTGSTNFIDVIGHTITPPAEGLALTTAQKKFGSAALTATVRDVMAVATFDFTLLSTWTLEGWIYAVPNVVPNDTETSLLEIQGNGTKIGIYNEIAPRKVQWIVRTKGDLFALSAEYTPDDFPWRGKWTHLAACADGATVKLFADGVQVGSVATPSGTGGSSSGVRIGQGLTNGENVIDELRFTNGVARYVENFTPPTTPFPDEGGYNPPMPRSFQITRGVGEHANVITIKQIEED